MSALHLLTVLLPGHFTARGMGKKKVTLAFMEINCDGLLG